MKYLNFLVLLIVLTSCGSSPVKKDTDSSSGYRSSGVEQFFMAELPKWANTSSTGSCYKSNSFIYLNFAKLKEGYQLNYLEMTELQAQYNERLENYYRSTAVRFLKPVEEASFFSNTLEQVRGGVRSLKLPPVREVEVIWLEAFTKEEIKKMAKSERFNEKLPVLFSSCHSKQTLAQWIAEAQLDDVGFYTMTAEWLSAFNSKGEASPGLHLELTEIFGKAIKVKLNTNNKTTTELLL